MDIEKTKVSIKTFVITLGVVISFTTSALLIWFRFITLEIAMSELESKREIELQEIKTRIEYINRRIDRRVTPIEQKIKELQE